jgi:hypothetical protein
MAGAVSKHRTGARRPDQVVTDALTWLRERGLVGWDEIVDRTRRPIDSRGYPTLTEGAQAAVHAIHLDPWGRRTPLVIVESESLAGLYEPLVQRYRAVLIAVRGQASGGLLFNDVAPYVHEGSEDVLYVGDHDKSGYDIEASAAARLADFAQRGLHWQRVALTVQQVSDYGLPTLPRTDGRSGKTYLVCETEAMRQADLTALVLDALDALLPESLDDVHEREQVERAEVLRRLDS